jgi:hypothetical protein
MAKVIIGAPASSVGTISTHGFTLVPAIWAIGSPKPVTVSAPLRGEKIFSSEMQLMEWLQQQRDLVAREMLVAPNAAPRADNTFIRQWPLPGGPSLAADAHAGDRDGPLVPLPVKAEPAREPPPFPLNAYRVLFSCVS